MTDAFRGTKAVVTGASSGIGQAIAIALSRCGVDRIVIHYRNNDRGAEQTADTLRQNSCEPILIAANLAERDERERLVHQAFQSLGCIHTWVNNAGADVLTGSSAELGFEDKLRELFEVDVIGTILLARAVSDRLIKQETTHPPSMVFIGWDQASEGMEGAAGQMFGPSKSAVMAFANSLAQTVAPRIRVNTVAPGWIKTSWGEGASPCWDQRAQEQALMARWGTPEDIAKAVVYVSDPANTFANRQMIEVNGGFNRRH